MSVDPIEMLRSRAQSGDVEAMFRLGRSYASHQEWSRARRYLREAAERGHAGAINELAIFTLFGIGIPPNVADATRQLEQAEAAGAGESPYQLALMAWCDNHVPFDLTRMAERLRTAAQRDFAPALRAVALVFARRALHDPAAAAVSDACMARAAALGDATATYLAARRECLRGEQTRGQALLALALARGATRARLLLDARTPAANPEQAVVAPPPQIPPFTLDTPPLGGRHEHCAAPLVETFEDVYGAEECEYVIALGEAHLERSATIHEAAPQLFVNDYRRSSDHSFYTFQEDFGLRWLQWRMLSMFGVPLANAEHLVLLRYTPGEEYKPHRDYLPPSAPGNSKRLDQPGQRVHTVFCYLADVDEGGETEFPLLGVRIVPKQGRIVHFRNLLADGQPDARTLHAGLPVQRGTKWLATLWTRERRMREY